MDVPRSSETAKQVWLLLLAWAQGCCLVALSLQCLYLSSVMMATRQPPRMTANLTRNLGLVFWKLRHAMRASGVTW